MAEGMSVSMTIRLIDEASSEVKGLTGAMRDLKTAGESVASATSGRAGDWSEERAAVQGVVTEVRTLGSLRQDTGAITAATSAYRDEAAAIETARAGGERLVDMVRRRREEERGAFQANQTAASGVEAPIAAAIDKLHEEAAAVEGVTVKMRELADVSRTAVLPIPPPDGPAFAGMGRATSATPVDWGDEAGRNRDWGTYWRERNGPPQEHEPEHPPAEPPPTATGGGGGIVSMMIGGAELGSGWKLIKGSYHEAADAAGQRTAMTAAGIPDAEAGELARASKQVSGEKKVFSENEVMELVRDARTILGSTPHAVEALPTVVDLATLAEAQRPGEGREGVMALLKGMETSGATTTPEHFAELSQTLAKVTNVFGKTIDFGDWGQVFKYGGTATQHLSPDFIEQKLPHLIQELGGASTGTMLQTMERAIVAGRMDKGAKETMEQYGLYDPATKKVKGADTFMRDPSEWVMSILKPTMDAAHLSEDERLRAEDKMFSGRLTARGMSILENQDANVEKNATQIRNARGLEAAPDLVRDSPALASRAASAQTGNFERRAGDPVIRPLIAVERAFTDGVVKMNGMFDRAPGAATAAAAGIVGGAGYLGWKTWESGIGDTVKSILRLPETAGKGLMQGVADGVNQAKTEAATPKTGSAGAPVERVAPAVDGLATATLRLSEASTSLGTFGMLAAWASRRDIGMGREPTAASLAQNPLGIVLPGDPGTVPQPAAAAIAAAVPPQTTAAEIAAAVQPLTEALREQARRSAEEFRRDPEAARGRAMMNVATDAQAGPALPPPSAVQAIVAPVEAAVQGAIARAVAATALPGPRPTAAEAPQQVTNNNQKTVNAPITVNAPVTINATMTNTTPAAIGAAVGGAVHHGVRAGAGALHDGSETK